MTLVGTGGDQRILPETCSDYHKSQILIFRTSLSLTMRIIFMFLIYALAMLSENMLATKIS